MTKWVWLGCTSLLLVFSTGCGGTCGTYCDYSLACLEEDLNGCSFEDPDELLADCDDECAQAMDKMTGDEQGDFDACVSCVADEIGSPDECNDGDYSDAFGDCEDECEERGVEEFFEEFDFRVRQNDLDC